MKIISGLSAAPVVLGGAWALAVALAACAATPTGGASGDRATPDGGGASGAFGNTGESPGSRDSPGSPGKADASAGLGNDASAVDPAVAGKVVMDNVSWPEGPLYTAGVLRWVGYGSGDVWQWDGTTVSNFWHQDGCGPSAIIDLPNGEYLVTCYDSNTIANVSATGKTIANIATDAAGEAFVGPNDFAKDARGGIYFTASGVFEAKAPVQGTVYFRAADGRITKVASNIHYANGLVVTDGGASLLVNEHLEAQVLKYTIQADGSLTNRQVFVRMKDVVPTPSDASWSYGCDGLKQDSKGNIYVANYGGGRLVVVNGQGKLVTTIPVPYADVDNVGFGPDLSVTGSGAAPSDAFLYVSDVKDDSTAPYPGAIHQIKNPVF